MSFGLRNRLFGSTREKNRPSTRHGHQSETIAAGEDGLNENSASSSVVHRREVPKVIGIDGGHQFNSIAFLDGKHIVSGDDEGKIQCWRLEDGREVGTTMHANNDVYSVAVSRNGRWIASGTKSGFVMVWNAETHEKTNQFQGHTHVVRAVDVSPDGTRIATGSADKTARIWSLSTRTGQRQPLVSWNHDHSVVAAKFSPDGCLVATATRERESVRIYHGLNDLPLLDVQIEVRSWMNNSIAWASDNKRLFVLSYDGNVYCLEVPTGTTLSKWPVQHAHTAVGHAVRCIALTDDVQYAAISAGETVTLWNTTTHEQAGPAIELAHPIWTMAISANSDLVISGKMRISVCRLHGVLPSSYSTDHAETLVKTDQQPQNQPSESKHVEQHLIQTHRTQEEPESNTTIIRLKKTVEELCNETIKSLHSDLSALETNSGRLEKAVQQLRGQLALSGHTANQEQIPLSEVIELLRTDRRVRNESEDDEIVLLKQSNTELSMELAKSQQIAEENYVTIDSLRADLHAQKTDSNNKIILLEQNIHDLHAELAKAQQKVDNLMLINQLHGQRQQCESLYTQGRIHNAAGSLLEMMSLVNEAVRADTLVSSWLPEFTNQCIERLESIGDEASSVGKHNEAVAAYFDATSLGPLTPNASLTKWASAILIDSSAQQALCTATKFKHPRFVIYCVICDALEGYGRFAEAIECFLQMQEELSDGAAGIHDECEQWGQEFQKRCMQELERLGDTARDSGSHDEAITHYSSILLLDPTNFNVLLKHSNEVINLDPLSHKGYEGKHTALHGMGHYSEAFKTFRAMLSKLERSPDPNIRKLRCQYVDATSLIQMEVNRAIVDMPTVLIDTETGYLHDKARQGEAFRGLPIYDELRSSMTTQLDPLRIRTEVERFYQYVMFSHRWQPTEPTFHQVENTPVYKLPLSPTFSKLRNFCELVCSLQFKWAWTDTCCVNQQDKGIQQESVVAMFRWYGASALTIVHLSDVFSDSQEMARLRRSVWNTRGWTYQEYVASKVVQFYTEDWKPYLGLQIFNHKESPDILLEMEQAMNFTTKQLTTLQPGLDKAREKLYLASNRQTTRVEDRAYSLFGIFNVALPVIYGEGIQAVGRLLEHILARSGDATLLAWTGHSGSHHSYLPADLTVYDQIMPPHIPPPVEPTEMTSMTTVLGLSLDVSQAIELYDKLHGLPPLSLVSGRLRLPGIIFPLDDFSPPSESESGLTMYRATSPMLGDVQISTKANLSGMGGLLLIHPWISPLLDRDFSYGVPQFDSATCALRLVVRLRQPFGALLLAPCARAQYRRVATDSLIMVRVREDVLLTELMDGFRTVDIQ